MPTTRFPHCQLLALAWHVCHSRCASVDMYDELKPTLSSDFTSFSLISLCHPRTPPRSLRLCSLRLRTPLGCDSFSQVPGISCRHGREEGGSGALHSVPRLGFVCCFLVIRPSYGFGGRSQRRGAFLPQPITLSTGLISVTVGLDPQLRQSPVV